MKTKPTENRVLRRRITDNPDVQSADIACNVSDGTAVAKSIAKGQPMKSDVSLGPDYSVDKRREARRKHTNHFTNRAPADSQ
jgi:hypothetical protein